MSPAVWTTHPGGGGGGVGGWRGLGHAPPPSCTRTSSPSTNSIGTSYKSTSPSPRCAWGTTQPPKIPCSRPALFNCPNSSQRGLCKQTGCATPTQALPLLPAPCGGKLPSSHGPQARPDRPVSSVVSPASLPELSPHQPTARLLSSHTPGTPRPLLLRPALGLMP